MTRIAEKKLEQMGATVHGVLAKNEVGRWVAVSEAGRVMWLDGFEGQASRPNSIGSHGPKSTQELIDRVSLFDDTDELSDWLIERAERNGVSTEDRYYLKEVESSLSGLHDLVERLAYDNKRLQAKVDVQLQCIGAGNGCSCVRCLEREGGDL